MGRPPGLRTSKAPPPGDSEDEGLGRGSHTLWVRVPPELFHYPLAEQSGVLATPSRWRSWVQIPSRGLTRRGTQLAKRQSSNLCDSVGSTPTRASPFTAIARLVSIRTRFVIAQQRASAGHWRAQVAVTHPPSGIGGSTPSRRTRTTTARSSSGSGSWPLKPATRVQIPHGSLIDMAKWCNWQTRDAQNVVPSQAWEFDSPLGHCRRGRCPTRSHQAGDPDRYRGLQLTMTPVGQRPAKPHTLRRPGATPGPAT